MLAANDLTHPAILSTYLCSVFYKSVILASFVITEFFRAAFASKCVPSDTTWVGCALPLTALIVNQFNNPATWFRTKPARDLISHCIYAPKQTCVLTGLLVVSILWQILPPSCWRSQPEESLGRSSPDGQLSLSLLALRFMVVPFRAWLITDSIRPMLKDLHIITTVRAGWPILWAYLLARLLPPY